MAFLKLGVLVKFLDDMSFDENGMKGGDHKPVLLQIRSIIPVLEDGNLWPSKGFYLKVCDVTHAMYVTLSEEDNEMVLSNNLKVGQFIYVQRMENSHPVPIMRGITPLPGRHPCEGTPEEIFSGKYIERFLEGYTTDSIVEKGVISEKKIDQKSSDLRKLSRAVSDSEALMQKNIGLNEGNETQVRSLSATIIHPDDQITGSDCFADIFDSEKMDFDTMKDLSNRRQSCLDYDSDSDHSTLSSVSSTRILKRRSWTQSELLSAKEMFDSSSVRPGRSTTINPEWKGHTRSRSANASPVRSVRYDSSDDNTSSTRQRRYSLPAKRSVKIHEKCNVPVSPAVGENSHPITLPSLDDTKGVEARVSWDYLPSSLMRFGKDVVRQRDVALRGAVEAVQEACAAERLIRCLSTFSEFQSNEADELQPTVDKFFKLQDDLAHTRLIMQSLTDLSLLRTSDASSTCTVKDMLDLAVERKKNANLWVKLAVSSDLPPLSNFTISRTAACVKDTTDTRKSCTACCANRSSTVPKQKRNDDMSVISEGNTDDQMEWMRGSSHSATTDLAALLQDECQKWFLSCAGRYLDEVEAKASSVQSDRKMASILIKIKKIHDWLDGIVSRDTNSLNNEGTVSPTLSESELETCEKLKSKIHGILLKNVERTAMAF